MVDRKHAINVLCNYRSYEFNPENYKEEKVSMEDVIVLLKEPELIPPESYRSNSSSRYTAYCGRCKKNIRRGKWKDNYCPHCGAEIDWENEKMYWA